MTQLQPDSIAMMQSFEGVRPGDLAMRLSFVGEPTGNHFKIDAVAGGVAINDPNYDAQFEAYTLPLAAATKVELEHFYTDDPVVIANLATRMPSGTSFAYDTPILLRNLVSGRTDIESAVHDLTDNDTLEAHERIWQVSVVGMDSLRFIRRSLYLAIQAGEMNKPIDKSKKFTHPQMRADLVNYMASQALNTYLSMPPDPS